MLRFYCEHQGLILTDALWRYRMPPEIGHSKIEEGAFVLWTPSAVIDGCTESITSLDLYVLGLREPQGRK